MYRSVLIIKLSSDKGPLIVLMTHNLQAAVLQCCREGSCHPTWQESSGNGNLMMESHHCSLIEQFSTFLNVFDILDVCYL